MNRHKKNFSSNRKKAQAGMALVETMIALLVLLIVAVGVMSLAAISLATTENQGHLQARAAEYAQDKMEQLLALTFCDSQTDTTVFPAVVTATGPGLAGCTNLSAAIPTASTGGSLSITAPVAGYVDYVDNSGNPVASTANWQYIRVWQISVPAGSTGLKQISIKCQARAGVGKMALPPNATIVSLKSYPF
jgi:Tfp pilus assembly protein PilV